MKKCSFHRGYPIGKSHLKVILYMKLSVFLILATCLQVSAKTYSQKISVKFKNATIKEALSDIEHKANCRFFYSDNQLPENTLVNLKEKDIPLEDLLGNLFAGTRLNYKILDNRVIIISRTMQEAQIKKISGTIKNESGQPLSGVSVQIKGSNKGAISDDNGVFSLEVPDNAVLVVSYVGYQTQEVAVEGKTVLDIALQPLQGSGLQDLVVTALGVKQTQKSLSYNVQSVSSDQLNTVKTDNMMNSLNGKVAGLTISPSASGVGGSAKVILRGSRSANGNNQPLYVIDGVPITNSANANGQQNGTFGGGPDGGDGISNLNPEDIESISVLEGASAAALYGSQAQNGVILITTKKGKAGHAVIQVNSSYAIDHIAYKPEFQNSYGPTGGTGFQSWGDKISGGGTDNLDLFYQNGTNWTNSVSFSAGSDKAQTYISYANTSAKGTEPGNKLSRNNFNLRETGHFLNDKLTVDGNFMFVNQKINNSPALGLYLNPLTGLYLFPRGVDITPYKTGYLNADATGQDRQNWPDIEDIIQNPWWILNKDISVANRNRIILSGNVKYDFTKWMNIQLRGNVDRTTDRFENDRYSGTSKVFDANGNGYMNLSNQTFTQKYGDVILTINDPNDAAKFKIGGIVGASITDQKLDGLSIAGELSTQDFFTTSNIIESQAGTTTKTLAKTMQTVPSHSQLQSIFANANLSYDNWAFLTLTGRNDWSSNLSYTPNFSYFYPSVGLSLIISQVLHMPAYVDYGKIRGTFAQVGNTVPPYLTRVQNTQNAAGQLQFNTAAAFTDLKPEKTNSLEFGTDWRFFNDRLNLSVTYYKTNTKNQYIPIDAPISSLISTGYVNAGNIQNTGIEFTINGDVIRNKNFTWNTGFNGSTNKNTIVDLDSKDGIDQFILTGNGNNSYQSILQKGGSYGDISGVIFNRDDQGRIIFSGSGTDSDPYRPESNGFGFLGNPNPTFQLGWSNSLTYKDFSLSLLVDGRFGGQVLSMTQMLLDQYGVSKQTGDARDLGYVAVNGVDGSGNAVSKVDPETWYGAIGSRSGISEAYIYSATVVRLREASLGYNFPINNKNSFFHSIKASLIGRNLIYFYKKAPFDPELTMSTGNGLSGVDVFNQPATRYMGISVNLTF
ncbi:TonB-linked outer membrane protein, SusC/RagA family [Arachidicoccus rhizosphaerae]|uniref:TonB-linked outer membrane protein, SusC/RagA family n=2 Tax=Arachidicoccus rhizosphaerae TaxID=551991 RepID=A0A1H3XSC7_9BACT|nr:TonB-linked outer membrane protein, SusC/RagA family [Arachidicoccus rhizosphaerae]